MPPHFPPLRDGALRPLFLHPRFDAMNKIVRNYLPNIEYIRKYIRNYNRKLVKRQVTFTADEEIQEIIKDANIPDKKQSKWINEKIKLGLVHEKSNTPEPTIRVKPRIKEVII